MCFCPCICWKHLTSLTCNDIAGVWSSAGEGTGAEDNPGPHESQSDAGATDGTGKTDDERRTERRRQERTTTETWKVSKIANSACIQ